MIRTWTRSKDKGLKAGFKFKVGVLQSFEAFRTWDFLISGWPRELYFLIPMVNRLGREVAQFIAQEILIEKLIFTSVFSMLSLRVNLSKFM